MLKTSYKNKKSKKTLHYKHQISDEKKRKTIKTSPLCSLEDIHSHNGYIEAKHLKIQENIDSICKWTRSKQMKINLKKSCGIIFNFTDKYKFTSRLNIDGHPLKLVEETK